MEQYTILKVPYNKLIKYWVDERNKYHRAVAYVGNSGQAVNTLKGYK